MTDAAVKELPKKLFAREGAKLLRMHVETFRSLARKNKVPRPVRVGGRLLWDRDELLAFLDGRAC